MIQSFTPLTYSPSHPGVMQMLSDPPSVVIPAPVMRVRAEPGAILRWQSHTPLDRVSIWLREITRLGAGPDPVLQLDLWAGPAGNTGFQVASVAKATPGLLTLDNLFLQVGGVRAQVWTVVARLIGATTPIAVGITIVGDRSQACALTVTT